MRDWYIYCDICGQRWLASETTELTLYTGRGGLIVCPNDVDKIDYGLVPYKPRTEENVPWTRINHTNTTDSSPKLNQERQALEYVLAASQDNIAISPSQSPNEVLTVYEKI